MLLLQEITWLSSPPPRLSSKLLVYLSCLPHLMNAPLVHSLDFFYLPRFSLISPTRKYKIPPTRISRYSNSLPPFVYSSLSHSRSHLASSTLQIIAENLRSCTVSLLLFSWDFLIHTFSLLTAPTAKHYQKEQTICVHITSHYPHSLFHLKLTDGTAVMYTGGTLTLLVFIPIQDTFTCSKICLHVKDMFVLVLVSGAF